MFSHLEHIYDPRERALVGIADLGLRAVTWPWRVGSRRGDWAAPRRILVLRLERIGDLLMTLGALESIRATWPQARIHLAVGSWNVDVARQLPWIDHVEPLDAPWLARDGEAAGVAELLRRTRRWRRERFELAMNLEGDIRSNLLLGLSGARMRVGFAMAGGGSVLTDVVRYDPRAHSDENTRAVVRAAAARLGAAAVEPPAAWPRFSLPAANGERAVGLLERGGARTMIGLHAGGGRAIKQWYPERFGQAVARIAERVGATIVLTGTDQDRPLVDEARAAIPAALEVIDLAGPLDLLTLAAVLSRLALYVTGDTGPMHLAAAMGTPVVGIFGISDPARYAPLVPHRRIVRIDLPCSPCNRVRLPPERCRGHVPDCLEGIGADMVARAGLDLLAEIEARRLAPGGAEASRERSEPIVER
jgi:ADP-heptose:LPS heptosyltransferase